MEFLREVPSVALCAETSAMGGYSTYFAEVFNPRPPIEQIKLNFEWTQTLQNELATTMSRPASRIKSVAIYIDGKGAFLLVTFVSQMQVANAKSSVRTAMRSFDPPQLACILASLHPFDELDKDRIDAMRTVASIQLDSAGPREGPPPTVVAQHGSYADMMIEPPPETRAQTLAEFLAADESDDEAIVLPDAGTVVDPRARLAIADTAQGALAQLEAHVADGCEHEALGFGFQGQCTLQGCVHTGLVFRCGCGAVVCDACRLQANNRFALLTYCADRAQTDLRLFDAIAETVFEQCGVFVAGVGEVDITFVRCYLEARRIQMIARRLSSDADLVDVVRVSLAMVEMQQLPAVGDKRAFNARCREVLKAVNPGAETDAKKLTVAQKLRLAMAWGEGGRCHFCAGPAEQAVAFEAMTKTYRHRLSDFRGGCTEIEPILVCHKCADLPITACGVCGGLEFDGVATRVWRGPDDPGYETLLGLTCKEGHEEARRSVAFRIRPHTRWQHQIDAGLNGARWQISRNEFDELCSRVRYMTRDRSNDSEPTFR